MYTRLVHIDTYLFHREFQHMLLVIFSLDQNIVCICYVSLL